MATEVGKVEVVLRARISQLEADLKKAEGRTNTSATRMRAAFAKMGAAAKGLKGNIAGVAAIATTIAGGALVGLAKQAISTANHIGDVAQKLGVSSSALQEFQYAANQSGVSAETLNMGLQRFGRRAAEAASGTGEARDAIKQLGLQLKDGEGNLRSTEDLFDDVMVKLGEVENPLERVRLAFKLFDSEGVGLANMAGSLGDLRLEAQSLGLVIDDEVIAKSDELQDSFDALWAITKGQLTPALVDLGGSAIQGTLEVMAELAGWANKIYRHFADISNLGLSNAQARLTETQEELAEAQERLNAAQERASKFKGKQGKGPLAEAQREVNELLEEERNLKLKIVSLTMDRVAAEEEATGAVTERVDTVADEKRAQAALARAVENRQKLAQRAHEDYLEQSGQRIRAIEEELARDIEALSTNLQAEEDYTDAIENLRQAARLKIQTIRDEEAEDLKDDLGDQKDIYKDLFDFMEAGFSDAMATMLLDGELTFKALAESFAREFLQKGITNLMGQAFDLLPMVFGGINPSTGGAFLGPGQTYGPAMPRANGGFVSKGPLLVGERGPELFMPSTSGYVASNLALSKMGRGGGGNVSVTVINNSSEEATTTERDGPNGSRQIEVLIGKAITKNINRGGDVDQAIRNAYGVNRVGRHGL